MGAALAALASDSAAIGMLSMARKPIRCVRLPDGLYDLICILDVEKGKIDLFEDEIEFSWRDSSTADSFFLSVLNSFFFFHVLVYLIHTVESELSFRLYLISL